MSRQESPKAYLSIIPVFNGTNYAFWKVRMEEYIMSLGVDFWTSVVVDYNLPGIPPIVADGKKLYGNNAKANNFILFGLSQSKLVKLCIVSMLGNYG